MQHDHINLFEYLKLRKEVICDFVDIRDLRIKDLSIGDGRGLGPFRVGISNQLLDWMRENNVPYDTSLYKECLFLKRLKYYTLWGLNISRPWLSQHMPENLRKYFRTFLRK